MRGLALVVSVCVASACGGGSLAAARQADGFQPGCLQGAECATGGDGDLVVPVMALVAAATIPVLVYKLVE